MTTLNAINPSVVPPKPKYGFEDVARLTKNTELTISADEFTQVIARDFNKAGNPIKKSNKDGISREEFVQKEFIDGNGHQLTTDEKNKLFDAIEAAIPNDDGTRLSDDEIKAYFSQFSGPDGLMDKTEWTDALGTPPASTPTTTPTAPNCDEQEKIIETILNEAKTRKKNGSKWFGNERLLDLINGVDPKDADKHPAPAKKSNDTKKDNKLNFNTN